MRLIESKVEYIPQALGIEGLYRHIERCARVAYKSEYKITDESSKPFVERIIKSHHGAVLEHGTLYLIAPHYSNKYRRYPYTVIREVNGTQYITTNYRVFTQHNDITESIKDICPSHPYHAKRYTMKFVCSRAIAQELTRHRVFSFTMESQRYCNYSKNKFGSEITFIRPSWLEDDDEEQFSNYLRQCEDAYFSMLTGVRKEGIVVMPGLQASPQQARDVLPNATKTELCMTGFASDWARLFELRLHESTGKVAPDMKVLMQKAWKEFENYGITRDLERYIKL